jgi:hypothetical protein
MSVATPSTSGHHRSTDVVGVIVRGQRADDAHAVAGGGVDDLLDGVGGVDHHRLSGRAITDQVREVHHLGRDGVAGREVAAREQTAEVKTLGH